MSGAKDEDADQLIGVTSHGKTTNLKPRDHLTQSPQQLVEGTAMPALLYGVWGEHPCMLGILRHLAVCDSVLGISLDTMQQHSQEPKPMFVVRILQRVHSTL